MRFSWSERKRAANQDEIRIISFRKATDREARRFFSEVQN